MALIIALIRHAEGEHNLQHDFTTVDPRLTETGKQQCMAIRRDFPHHDKVTYLFASPSFRTIETALYSFKPAINRGVQIVAIHQVQECSDEDCNRSRRPEVIKSTFGDVINVDELLPGWYDKGPGGPNECTRAKLAQRALDARKMIQDVARAASNDACIFVESHDQFLRLIANDSFPWRNAEWNSYTIKDDEAATLVQI